MTTEKRQVIEKLYQELCRAIHEGYPDGGTYRKTLEKAYDIGASLTNGVHEPNCEPRVRRRYEQTT